MNSSTQYPLNQPRENTTGARGPSLVSRIARRGLIARLRGLNHGCLRLRDGDQVHEFGHTDARFPRPVTVHIRNPACYADIAFGGSIGAGESYMHGLWDCDDLPALMRLMLVNRPVLEALDRARLRQPLHRLFHALHRNSVAGSRRNIHAHYDLGNDFFRLFLDDTLMYSSAVFDTPDTGLREASVAKLERICQKLDLGPGDHVLEIGTGWGGFALHAARHYGCRVTTTTISEAQYREARRRVAEAGLEDRITLLQKDFRHLEGEYDKLVSIEMIEAIGERNIGAFFAVCQRCLKPGGRMLLQAITISEQQFPDYRKSVDFIQRFIFPGGFLPSLGLLCREVGARSDLRVLAVEDIGAHYATTLRHWRHNLERNREAIRELGYSEAFLRLWRFYFCYCEAGFEERATGDLQMVLLKP